MHILVTGGAGYLGCCLVPYLLEQEHSVRLFDRFCFDESAIATFASSDECEVIKGDMRRLQEFPDLLDDIEAVIHLAGLSNDPSCDLDPELTQDVNIDSTRELIKLAVEKEVRRFVLASSCSVYGSGVFDILDELSPVNPVSAYAVSKIDSERDVFAVESDTFEPVALRPATLFGLSPRMRFDLAVNQMTATASRGGNIVVRGGGNQWRPFVHVRDAARAFALMAEAPAEAVKGEVFNLGDDNSNLKIVDLAEVVAKEFDGLTVDVTRDDEDRRSYRVDFSKLRDQVGFTCENSIVDGVREIKKALEESSFDPFDEEYFNVQRMKALLAKPVDDGGEPICPRFIPLARPLIEEEEEEAVLEALRSGWVTSGPQISAFESALAERLQAAHVVATTSCTSALHLCLAHLGLKPGDEVVTTPITWPSVGNVILSMGVHLAFADIDRATLNMDPASLKKTITENTKAIMPVHMAGQPCDLEAIYAIAERHGIPVIEDAAHAIGASYKGKPIGSYGDFACFSFYAIKNITTMEGGAIALQDADVAARLRLLAANGVSATAWERYGRSAIATPPEVIEPGYKYLMGNVSAAMGLAQLNKLPRFLDRRRRLATLYRAALADIDEIWLPELSSDSEHAWHLMVIRLKLDKLAKDRNEIAHALRRENVGTAFHFFGLHLHQYYREELGFSKEKLPEATAASHEVLSLPLYPGMTDKNVHEVVEALKKVLLHARI